jgi:hypothetical protein
VLSLRAHLAAYRGLYDDAIALSAGAAEDALRIGDLQAVLPTLAALAATQAGLGDDADAVDSLRRAIEKRGVKREAIISSWFLFEAADTLSAIAVRDSASPALRMGLELLASFAVTLAADAAAPGDLVQAEVRRAMFGAGADQLATLARAAGLAPAVLPIDASFPDRAAAIATLAREHRVFDVARICLWLAEERRDPVMRAAAEHAFEELGAHPYLVRSQPSG